MRRGVAGGAAGGCADRGAAVRGEAGTCWGMWCSNSSRGEQPWGRSTNGVGAVVVRCGRERCGWCGGAVPCRAVLSGDGRWFAVRRVRRFCAVHDTAVPGARPRGEEGAARSRHRSGTPSGTSERYGWGWAVRVERGGTGGEGRAVRLGTERRTPYGKRRGRSVRVAPRSRNGSERGERTPVRDGAVLECAGVLHGWCWVGWTVFAQPFAAATHRGDKFGTCYPPYPLSWVTVRPPEPPRRPSGAPGRRAPCPRRRAAGPAPPPPPAPSAPPGPACVRPRRPARPASSGCPS